MVSHNDNTHRVGYYDRVDEHNNYQLSAGTPAEVSVSGYYSHEGDMARMRCQCQLPGWSLQCHRFNNAGRTHSHFRRRCNAPLWNDKGDEDANWILKVFRTYRSVAIAGTSHYQCLGQAVISDVNGYYRNKAVLI